jgi:hypothetical protein
MFVLSWIVVLWEHRNGECPLVQIELEVEMLFMS